MTSLQGTTVHDQRKGVLHQNEQIKSVLGHFRAQKLHVRVRVCVCSLWNGVVAAAFLLGMGKALCQGSESTLGSAAQPHTLLNLPECPGTFPSPAAVTGPEGTAMGIWVPWALPPSDSLVAQPCG